jgi:hypothetical protein
MKLLRLPKLNDIIKLKSLTKTQLIIILVISTVVIGAIIFIAVYFTVGINNSLSSSLVDQQSTPTSVTPEMLTFNFNPGLQIKRFLDTNGNNIEPPVYRDNVLPNSTSKYIINISNVKLDYYIPVNGSISAEIIFWVDQQENNPISPVLFYNKTTSDYRDGISERTITIDRSNIINVNGINMYRATANYPNVQNYGPIHYSMLQISVNNVSYPKNQIMSNNMTVTDAINTLIKSSYANSIITITCQERAASPVYTYSLNTSKIEAPTNMAETGWNIEYTKYTSAQNQVFLLPDMITANQV